MIVFVLITDVSVSVYVVIRSLVVVILWWWVGAVDVIYMVVVVVVVVVAATTSVVVVICVSGFCKHLGDYCHCSDSSLKNISQLLLLISLHMFQERFSMSPHM